MNFPSEKDLHQVAHDITMKFLRRNAPAPLAKGASYALSPDKRAGELVKEYLATYKVVVAHLREQ